MRIQTTTLIGVILTTIANATSFEDVVSEEWNEWKTFHGKTYRNKEEDYRRMKVFMDNKEKIASHNSRYHEGKETYTMKMNHLGDLFDDEHEYRNGYDYEKKKQLMENKNYLGATHIYPAHVHLPEHVDWRKLGAVTEVKDQGLCGSCWAFATTGALEGQHFRKTGELVSLSEQQLIDCSRFRNDGFTWHYANDGCDGGIPDLAFEYISKNGGIDTERSYPYIDIKTPENSGIRHHCHFNPRTVGATEKGYVDIPEGDEEALKAAVAIHGPVAVAINAEPGLRYIEQGVYQSDSCTPKTPEDLNHAVLVVGYGTEWKYTFDDVTSEDSFEKIEYWIIKNSWGKGFGENGFFKLRRNFGNMCGVAFEASYPLV